MRTVNHISNYNYAIKVLKDRLEKHSEIKTELEKAIENDHGKKISDLISAINILEKSFGEADDTYG